MGVALNALATIEEHYGHQQRPRRKTMTVHGWEARADGSEGYDALVARLPREERHMTATAIPASQVTTTSAATVVRLAKFSTQELVRGRAFYFDREPALAVKFAVGASSGRTQLEREIVARTALAGARHLPAPTLVAADVTAGLTYLAETVVFGQHAREPAHRQTLALELVTGLLLTHRDIGVTDEPITLHRQTLDRLRRLVGSTTWVTATQAESFLGQAERLIEDDDLLPVGWCHGDLGFSNVIVDDAGAPTLIDWEHAARMPVAADLAKLAAMSPVQSDVIGHIVASARPEDIGARPGRRTVVDQLALMVLRELSWWESRRTAAIAAGRLTPYERGIRRRFRLLDLLLPPD